MLQFLPRPATGARWLLAGLCEVAVATPWMILLYAADKPAGDWPAALPGAWVMLAVFLAAAIWEGGNRQGQESWARRLTALGLGVGAAYAAAYYTQPLGLRQTGLLSMNPAQGMIPVAAYLWYQGSAAAARGLEFGVASSRFARQVLLLIAGLIALMLMGITRDARIQVLLYWHLILLFTAGLMLILIARDRALRAGQTSLGDAEESGKRLSTFLNWSVLLLVGVTLAASQFLSLERLLEAAGTVSRGLSAPFNWLVDVALLIITRWLLLANMLVSLIGRLFPNRRPLPPPAEEEPLFGEQEPIVEIVPQVAPEAMQDLTPYVKAAVMGAAVLAAGIMLYRLSRRRDAVAGDAEEERVSLGFWMALLDDVKNLLQSLRSSGREGGGPSGAERIPLDPKDPRALFRRLQKWGRDRGRSRRAHETPAWYARSLAAGDQVAKECAPVVADVYNLARYGPAPPAQTDVEQAAEAMERLEKP